MRRKHRARNVLRPSAVLHQQRDVKLAGRKGLFSTRFYNALKDNPTADICITRKVGGIGDVLMMTPALRELKRRLPDLNLTVGVDRHTTYGDIYYELVKNAPFIDNIVDARHVDRKRFYRCIDISAVCIPYERKALPPRNRINLFANHLGLQKLEDTLPFYEVSPEERLWSKIFYRKNFNSTGPVIALHTASNEEKRSWPVHQMLKFIRYMKHHVPAVQFLVLDQNMVYPDWNSIEGVVALKSSTIREMAALIEQCAMFVGPDSGPMHIAGALRKKSVIVFGSIPPEARLNHYKSHVGVRMDELKCIGCWYAPCPYDIKCMKKLEGGRVGKVALSHLKEAV